MKRQRKLKLNNQGSTFVVAIIVITLITMLAVAILSAATHNIAMKNVDRNSKTTFYTAESVMDEIRAGVGLDSMNELGEAYETVLTTIIKEDPSGYSYVVDNETANEEFRAAFIEGMLGRISSENMAFVSGSEDYICVDVSTREFVKTYLQGFIKGYDEGMAKISSVGNIEAYKNSTSGRTYMLIIRDVAVAYKEEKQGEIYFTDVTADLEIQFPNMTVNFSTSNRLNDFIKYAMIADDNLTIRGKTVNTQSSIYAGEQLTVLSDNTTGKAILNMTSEYTADGGTANIVCGGNTSGDAGSIVVKGSADITAELYGKNVNIWCTNLVTKPYEIGSKDKSAGTLINITGDDTKTIVKDDLTIEGQDSVVSIDGEYYGYSYDGYDVNALHANSSAIIINGKRARLTLGTSRMILGGHAYIEIGTDYYTTGESLAFKGDQEIYLMPSEYIGINYEGNISNPMSVETWDMLCAAASAADSRVKICDPTEFFAYSKGYITTGTPYTEKRINGLVYLYINFSSKEAAANYVYDVANGRNGAPAYLKALLNKYTSSLFEGSTVSIAGGGQIYTKGALLTTSGGNAGTVSGTTSGTVDNWVGSTSGATSTLGNDEFVLTSLDLKNRYEIFTHLLADLPWTDTSTGKRYIVNDIDSALWAQKDYIVSGDEFDTSNIFDNIVDRDMLTSAQYNATGKYIQYGSETENFIKIAIVGDYVIPANCTGGIVVATGDITVQNDFQGLIISGKDINVVNNATIKSLTEVQTEYLIMNEVGYKNVEDSEVVAFKEYFYAYKNVATDDDSREEVKVEQVDYRDIVNYNNWRKYED